ncbi:hypothetical protein BC826DRAFT_1067539 [Russula brevipes]|nr:hypothetical protein BC826DRAFT_1067539 [Russula brevipes]
MRAWEWTIVADSGAVFSKHRMSPHGNIFDSLSFCNTVNHCRRGYRNRTMEVIRTCRLFSTVSRQCYHQVAALLKVQGACDEFVRRAVRSKARKCTTMDHYFEKAIRALHDYEEKFHPRKTIGDLMEKATNDDSKKENLKSKTRNKAADGTLNVVEFHILRSLPDENPTIVRQALPPDTNITEILWNFSHYEGDERLNLVRNPHFYSEFPQDPTGYVNSFRSQQTENFVNTIYVLTNNSRRVFFDFGKELRAFDDVWITNNTLIFKDIAGKLEGETTVQTTTIRGRPLLWRGIEPTTVGEVEDWRDQIRRLLGSSDAHHVHISTNGPSGCEGRNVCRPPPT